MTLVLNGTTGVSAVDGSASTPAIQGADTNTGVFFPAADTVAVATGGSERMRVDSSGNVGVGTTSPSTRLEVVGGITLVRNTGSTNYASLRLYNDQNSGSRALEIDYSGSAYSGALLSGGPTGESAAITTTGAYPLVFGTSNTARAMLDSSGNLLVGTTSNTSTLGVAIRSAYDSVATAVFGKNNSAGDNRYITFFYGGAERGYISYNGSGGINYFSASDYRLKEDIAPMTGALAKVAALKPVTYKWKESGKQSEGFIAHELAEVCPDAVAYEKDAVDADGNPQYQGIDTSFLVATLTAAIQELKAELDALKAQVAGAQA